MIDDQTAKACWKKASSTVVSLALAFTCALTTTSQAAEIEVYDLDDEQKMIVIGGEITEGDSNRFRTAAAQIDDALVVLESEGGSTMEALEIGETIRIKGFSTLVVNESVCVSACGLIWLSGSPRAITQSARVGFHATYTDDSGRKLESGVGNALVGRYLALLNLPRKAVIFTTSAPPEKLNWLNASNASSLGVETRVLDDFENAGSSSPEPSEQTQPPPMSFEPNASAKETTRWGNADGWIVAVDHTLDNSCFAMRSYEDDTTLRIGINAAGNGNYLLVANPNWTSLQDDKAYPINIQFDDEDEWDAPAVGVTIDDTVALWINFSDNEFWAEFGIAKAVRMWREQRSVGTYLLDGSYAAVEMVIACQKAYNQGRQKRDPFAD